MRKEWWDFTKLLYRKFIKESYSEKNWKSATIWQNYGQEFTNSLFGHHVDGPLFVSSFTISFLPHVPAPACDRQTDGQTHGNGIHYTSNRVAPGSCESASKAHFLKFSFPKHN